VERTVRLTQRVDAPLERVWAACTEQQRITQWQADEVRGQVAPGETLELSWPSLGVELQLSVLEVDPPRRLTLATGSVRLGLELAERTVTLTHTGLSLVEELEGVSSSWRLSLAQLAHYCERHPDARRSVRWLVGNAHTSHHTAHVFFSDKAALASWLGASDGIGEVGSSYQIDLPGEPMSGRVLANTPDRDLAISWTEDGDSVLFFRTLPHPTEPDQRLIVLTWSRWNDQPPPTRRKERLESAHQRLVQALDAGLSA
jgi:uncharacterized protein YndB with AHSA1/START domain